MESARALGQVHWRQPWDSQANIGRCPWQSLVCFDSWPMLLTFPLNKNSKYDQVTLYEPDFGPLLGCLCFAQFSTRKLWPPRHTEMTSLWCFCRNVLTTSMGHVTKAARPPVAWWGRHSHIQSGQSSRGKFCWVRICQNHYCIWKHQTSLWHIMSYAMKRFPKKLLRYHRKRIHVVEFASPHWKSSRARGPFSSRTHRQTLCQR